MGRRAKPVLSGLGPLTLDRGDSESLHRQLYRALRQAVVDGRLRPGERLPSSRNLATELQISRNTVVNAYEALLSEGYITGKVGAGSFIATSLPDRPPHGTEPKRMAARQVGLSRRGAVLAAPTAISWREGLAGRPFSLGAADLDVFPFALWGQLLGRCWRVAGKSLGGDPDPLGHLPLRAAIADYLRAMRAVRCEAEQVVIVSGAQQGLALMAQLLIDSGDRVWTEDPLWPGNSAALAGAGAQLVPVPVDSEGLVVADGVRRAPDARLALVTPSHQFPLGVTMSLRRRLELLDWAAAADAWIIEDDYDSEFRYTGPPLAALQGLDGARRVVYVGSFSKVMFPGLRLGYVVVPPDLIGAAATVRRHFDGGTSMVPQAALHRFLADGHFASHLRAMRTLYAGRRAAILAAASEFFEPPVTADAGEAGLHITLRLPAGPPDTLVSAAAAKAGLRCPPLSPYFLTGNPANGLVLGFAAYPEPVLRAAMRDLADLLRRITPKGC